MHRVHIGHWRSREDGGAQAAAVTLWGAESVAVKAVAGERRPAGAPGEGRQLPARSRRVGTLLLPRLGSLITPQGHKEGKARSDLLQGKEADARRCG